MKVKLEFQYFEGCPNHIKMQKNLTEAIKGLEDKIEIEKVLVEDKVTALQVKFRGSPTLLINGEDFLGMPAPEEPSLGCRYYPNGIPSSNEIKNKILEKFNKKNKPSK
ncbi:MAG: putative alkylmercury lyase [Ignavibacteriae bacterium]|nr:MAG: putative alkylmercury lyase [Ignavibacteriota bacterium]